MSEKDQTDLVIPPRDLTSFDLAEESWVESVFRECVGLSVELDEDPLLYGPTRINQKIAACRRYLDRTEVLFNEVSRRLQVAKRIKRKLDTQFTLEEAGLMADDPEVRAQRALADRKALVVTRLPDLVRRQYDIQSAIQDLEAVLTIVKAKRADLRNIQSHIKEQVKMCQESMGLGARWGSRTPPGKAAKLAPQPARPVAKDPSDLSNLIEKDEREIHEVEPIPPEYVEEPEDSQEVSEESEEPTMDDLLRREVLKAGGNLDGMEEWDDVEDNTDDADAGEVPEEPGPEDLGDVELEPEVAAEFEAKIKQAEEDIAL